MKTIDWLYHRKGCTTCGKAQTARAGVTITEQVDAVKVRYDAKAALKLLNGINRIVAAKGTKIVDLNVKEAAEEEVLALIMGPTGNLRAPTAKVGKTWLVGFHPDADAMV